ncbi:MAG: hypothetical protein RLZZ40_23, partial [Actinomycetota bacterium]
LDNSGDVDERHRCRQETLAAENLGEFVQARVGKVDDSDIGFNRRERIVRRENVVASECIEEGRLAYVRESDDADGKSHRTSLGERWLLLDGSASGECNADENECAADDVPHSHASAEQQNEDRGKHRDEIEERTRASRPDPL